MSDVGDLVHEWEYEGRVITFRWLGDVEVAVSRVYALAFAPDGRMLLVTDDPDDGLYWLPGGGIEAGESEVVALARELEEEAGASLEQWERLGVQVGDDPLIGRDYSAFYWCRVSFDATFVPAHEVLEARLVRPEEFLDLLFWGRSDPKGAMLLERALGLQGA